MSYLGKMIKFASMELQTKVDISRKLLKLTHEDGMVLMGSCFADNIGDKLREAHFDCCVNPFGTLYNPMSVGEALREILRCRRYEASDSEVFEKDGVWHSWMHHSRFSAGSVDELLDNINGAISDANGRLLSCRLLVVTLGTSYVYRLRGDGRLVANCHKVRESEFVRGRLSVEDVVDEWLPLLDELHAANPDMKVMFTVSPIRHKRDGLHANQLSKSVLLLAADRLCGERPDMCLYFPAYEIVVDELRDYRFYADDLVHPSAMAVEYIWERFCDAFFDRRTMEKVTEWRKYEAHRRHRPLM